MNNKFVWNEGDVVIVARAKPAGLAKHDGPGPHDNGSPQSVHGGDVEISETENVADMKFVYIKKDGREIGEVSYKIKNGQVELSTVTIFKVSDRRKGYMTSAVNLIMQREGVDSIYQDNKGYTQDGRKWADSFSSLIKGDFEGHPFRGNQYDHAGAVVNDQHAIEMASKVPGDKKMPWEMNSEEYNALEVIYRGTGSASKKEGPAFFTNDQEVARAHGKVKAFRVLPGAVIYPDPELEGAEDRALTGRESLDLGSAVLSYDDLVPDFAFDVWKKAAGPGDLAKGEQEVKNDVD